MKSLTSIPRRAVGRLRLRLQGRLKSFKVALPLVEEKKGLEIGGPSDVFQGWRQSSRNYGRLAPLPLYDKVASLDNCDFSDKTIWANHENSFRFSKRRSAGKIIIADGSALSPVADQTYDFVLSSHNLEHFANPVKALKEWKRVTRAGGALILVIPDYRRTFDHRRTPTAVDHMLDDYSNGVEEDDTTHVSEVLKLHDVAMDGTLKTHTIEELRARSLDNFSNRVLHHHVFDEGNSTELLRRVGLEVLAVERALPYHIVVVSRWKH